jgi:hypothetical protein
VHVGLFAQALPVLDAATQRVRVDIIESLVLMVQSVALDVVDDELAVQLHPSRPDEAEVDADDLGVEVLVREV